MNSVVSPSQSRPLFSSQVRSCALSCLVIFILPWVLFFHSRSLIVYQPVRRPITTKSPRNRKHKKHCNGKWKLFYIKRTPTNNYRYKTKTPNKGLQAKDFRGVNGFTYGVATAGGKVQVLAAAAAALVVAIMESWTNGRVRRLLTGAVRAHNLSYMYCSPVAKKCDLIRFKNAELITW